MGRRWTETETERLTGYHAAGHSMQQMATRLKRSLRAVDGRLMRLRRSGQRLVRTTGDHANWEEDDRTLRAVLPTLGFEETARLLQRGVPAVKRRAARIGASVGGSGTCRLIDVARRFGVCERTVRKWLARGWLEGRPPTARGRQGSPWRITPEQVEAFMRAYPVAYEAALMPREIDGQPNPYRALIVASTERDYLALKQCARRLQWPLKKVQAAVRRKRLPACHLTGAHPREWFVRPEDLARFQRAVRRETERSDTPGAGR